MMAEGMTGTLNRMLTIARTEQLRTYRESSIASYKESGIVTGYRRLCAHDRRTCAACIMSEGQFYDLDEEMPEHPNGRCAMIPVVKGVPPVQWLKGEEWFEQQDAATQQDILGKGHYDGWKAGQFALQDVVKVTPNSTWGPSLGVTPLRDLGGQAGRVALPSLPPAPIPQVQPVSSRLQFRSVPEGLLRSYGYDASTATQQQKLLDAVDTLAQPIQSMWKGGDVILAISPNPYTATHQSKWIIMGESSMNVPETLQHEFIHHILEQQQFREALPGFRPSTTLFRHAAEGADSLNEEMTMVLTKYHLERETWVRNLVNESWDVLNNGQPVTPEVARDKARDVADFLRTLGVEL
jgi:SPP1 gp7 family putative phage head morphogenesis protein